MEKLEYAVERMAALELRIEELERRLDAVTGASIPQQPRPAGAPDASDARLISVTITNKRFEYANPDRGEYDSFVWFDCAYDVSASAKPMRAVKGVLTFCDLFGELKFALNVTINEGLVPGRTHRLPGTGFSFNEFIDEHHWMMATDLSNMVCALEDVQVIYTDGTTAKLPQRS